LIPPAASDVRSDLLLVARGGGIKVLGTSFRVLGGLGVSVLITRLAGATPFGHYYMGLTCAQMLSQVAGLGLQSSVLRFIPIARQQKDLAWLLGILRAGTWIPTGIGLLLASAMYFSAEMVAQQVFADPDLAVSLRLFAFAIPATALANALETSLRGFNRIDLSTLGIDVAFQLLKLILVALALVAGMGVAGAAFAHIAALLACSLLLFTFLRPRIPSRECVSRATYRMGRLWHQSLPTYLTNLLRIFNGRLELLLLGVFGIAFDVATYAAALQIGMVGSMLMESLITATMPLISGAHFRGGHEAVRPILLNTTRWCLIATLPFFVAISLFAEPILVTFGETFVAGRGALLLLAALPLLNSAAGVASAVLVMTGNAKLNTVNSVVYLALAVGFDVALIPTYGIQGAALSVFGATLALNLLRTIQVRWVVGFWPFDTHVLKPIAAASVAGLTCFAVQTLLVDFNRWLVLSSGIGALVVIYSFCLLALGISEEDRIILKAIGKKCSFLGRATSRLP